MPISVPPTSPNFRPHPLPSLLLLLLLLLLLPLLLLMLTNHLPVFCAGVELMNHSGNGSDPGSRCNRLGDTAKTRKKREKTGGKMGEMRSKRCEARGGCCCRCWVPAFGSLEPPQRDGENAQKTGENGVKMGEIRSKTVRALLPPARRCSFA